MKSEVRVKEQRRGIIRQKLRKLINCLCAAQESRPLIEMAPPAGRLVLDDGLLGVSPSNGEVELRTDSSNIEEAESSLRDRGSLNYEEARALLGRIEYQKGNMEAALHVFEGINISSVTPKIKISLVGRGNNNRRQQPFATLPMSSQAVSLLLEAMFLKAKSLQHLGRFKEAAQSCKVIVDILESSFPEGLPENFAADCKLQETVIKSVELLPELWKLADCPHEAITFYRRALLHNWNFNAQTTARVQKEFSIMLLYGGHEANPPELRSQMDNSFVPRNNMEEALILLMILLRKVYRKVIAWDASILDHLCFALSMSSNTKALSSKVLELIPEFIDRREGYYTLALCYCGAGEDHAALNLLRKLLHAREDPENVPGLLLASKICSNSPELAEEGVNYSRRARKRCEGDCHHLESASNYFLGVSLSSHSRSAISTSEMTRIQSEALETLEAAARMTNMQDADILYHLSLEYAQQRKLDPAHHYAKQSLKLENGANIRGWLLLSRILSAQKRFDDAENIISSALDQTGIWDQGELLRTKAKLQIAQGQLNNAIETYIQLLAVLQVRSKSYGSGKRVNKPSGQNSDRKLEAGVWNDLASVYISLSRWSDAESCLAKSKAICPSSAVMFHTTGLLHEKKGLHEEALNDFTSAVNIDPTYVPSLISAAVTHRRRGDKSSSVAKSFLMEALSLDRTNHSAWYNLGLLYSDTGEEEQAAECFMAADSLEETAPVEPLR